LQVLQIGRNEFLNFTTIGVAPRGWQVVGSVRSVRQRHLHFVKGNRDRIQSAYSGSIHRVRHLRGLVHQSC